MEAGKEASDIKAPHDYRKSMISLSDKSLVPIPMTPRKTLHSPPIKTCNNPVTDNGVETDAAQSEVVYRSFKGTSSVGHGYPSCASAYSSSVYSDHSVGTPGARTSSRERFSDAAIQARLRSANEKRCASANEPSLKHTCPLHINDLKSLTEAPARRSLEPAQPTEVGLTRNSVTHPPEMSLLNDSSSESEASSPSSTKQSCDFIEHMEHKLYRRSSEFSNPVSSENVSDSKRVSTSAKYLCFVIDAIAAGPCSLCERQGSKTAWIRTRDVKW